MGDALGRGFDIRIDKTPAPKPKRANLERPDMAWVAVYQTFVFGLLLVHL